MLLSSLIMVSQSQKCLPSVMSERAATSLHSLVTHSPPSPSQVTSGFKAKSMAAALPPPFLEPLFSISLMEESELRQLVLEILHNIIDRHDNRAKLRGIRYLQVRGPGSGERRL